MWLITNPTQLLAFFLHVFSLSVPEDSAFKGKVGDRLYHKGFMSTSLKYGVAKNFSWCVNLFPQAFSGSIQES